MEYKDFFVKDIANVQYGNKFDKNKMTHKDSNIAFVSRTAFNNGISDYVDVVHDIEPYPAGCVTLALGGSIGSCFLQEQPFYTGQNVGVFIFEKRVSKEAKIYFISVLSKKCKNGFSAFGNEINKHLKTDLSVTLPIQTDKNNDAIIDATCTYHSEGYIPDWNYMQECIEELEQERIEELEQYLISTGLDDYELTDEDKEILSLPMNPAHTKASADKDVGGDIREMRGFKVEELFIVSGTKSLDAGSLSFENHGINFIGRTNDNNGIQGKIPKQKFEPNEPETFTATVIGNYKYVRFQEEPYYCSQNINKLIPKFKITKNIAIYFMSILQKFVALYNGNQGGYKLNELMQFNCVLPIKTDSNNNPIIDSDCKYHKDGYIPDFEYMEKYIRALEKVVIADVVKYKDEVIDKTKEIVKY